VPLCGRVCFSGFNKQGIIEKMTFLKKPLIRIRRLFAILKAVAFVTYKEWVAYRTHMVVSLFVGPVFFLVQVFIWQAVFAGRATINGQTLAQMLTYYGVAAVINYLTFDSADWNLQMLVHTGRFLTFMLRPLSHRFFALSQKVGHRLLGLWVEFIPIYLLFMLVFKISLIPARPFWAVISIVLSFWMLFLINYCIGIAAFWLTKTDGMRRMFQIFRDTLAGVFIPLTFFPEFLQKVLFFLPFQYVTYVPVQVFMGSYRLGGIALSIPEIVGIQAVAVLVMWLASEILLRFGIRKFTGVGI
jgi:ABC-2 type transport system permease protein